MLSVPVIHQTFAQLTADSDLQIISNASWNNRGQNSWGERGEIFFYLPLPGASVQTYGDVITKFSRMDSLLSLLRYGASRSLAKVPLLDPGLKLVENNKNLFAPFEWAAINRYTRTIFVPRLKCFGYILLISGEGSRLSYVKDGCLPLPTATAIYR